MLIFGQQVAAINILHVLWLTVFGGLMTMLLAPNVVFAQTITVDGNPSDWAAVYSSSSVTIKSLKRDANDTNDDQFT